MDMGFGAEFGAIGGLFSLFFVVVVGVIVFSLFRGVSQWHRNNQSPELSVEARIVSKRTSVNHHHHAGDNATHSTTTHYFVTFEVESGDRIEFHVDGQEFGLLAEGDSGKLSFQGTRYLGFMRNRRVEAY